MPGASTLEILQRAKGATARPSGFSSSPPRPASPTESVLQAQAPELIPTFRQGDRCTVGGKEGTTAKKGIVQFVGEIGSLGPGLWVGVQLRIRLSCLSLWTRLQVRLSSGVQN